MIRANAPAILAVAFIASVPFFVADYSLIVLTYTGLAAIAALGLVLLTGKAGLTSFGQSAFVGSGAYISALLSRDASISPWLTLPIVLVAAGVMASLIGVVTSRLSGHYLSLATLAQTVVAFYLFAGLDATGGMNGFADIPALPSPSGPLTSATAYYALTWGFLLFFMFLLHNLDRSRVGRSVRALKQGTLLPEAMGVDTGRLKVQLFVVASMLAAFSGWLYAHFQRFVNPSPFSPGQSIEYLLIAIVGGASSLWGAIVGSSLVTLVRQVLETWAPSIFGQGERYEGVLFGLLFIAALQLVPEGIVPNLARWAGYRHRPRSPRPGALLENRTKPPPGTPLLSVSGARKAFGGLVANDNVGMELAAGRITALIGPNGAGKSTFFNLVSGVIRSDAGEFRFMGRSLGRLSLRAIAGLGIARTFQHVRLVPDMTLIENVALGAYPRAGAGLVGCMLRIGAEKERAVMAEAYHQIVRVGLEQASTAPAGFLSLGRQRLAEIARALAADPYVLLLDEPAAGLRLHEKQELASLLRALRDEGVAILIVEHDMNFIMSLADHVVVLNFGCVIAADHPEAIMQNSRVIDAYLGAAE